MTHKQSGEEELFMEYWECAMDLVPFQDLEGTNKLKKSGLGSRSRVEWLMGSDIE